MNKTLWVAAAIVVLGVGAYFYINNSNGASVPADANTDSSAMRVENNMVVINDQKPGSSLVASQVHLAAPGFLVIHEDSNGEPSAILGVSALMPAGDSANVQVALNRPVTDGMKLHAVLRLDANGDGKFDPTTDRAAESKLGGPIDAWFNISSNASENAPVSI